MLFVISYSHLAICNRVQAFDFFAQPIQPRSSELDSPLPYDVNDMHRWCRNLAWHITDPNLVYNAPRMLQFLDRCIQFWNDQMKLTDDDQEAVEQVTELEKFREKVRQVIRSQKAKVIGGHWGQQMVQEQARTLPVPTSEPSKDIHDELQQLQQLQQETIQAYKRKKVEEEAIAAANPGSNFLLTLT